MPPKTTDSAPVPDAQPSEGNAPVTPDRESLLDEVRAIFREEANKLRSELVHTTSTPAAETVQQDETPPPDGAYCNQCVQVSRPEALEDGSKEKALADAKLGTGGDLLWALNHNSHMGHHVTIWTGEQSFQVSPRSA